jgi:Raf kinase inhibitor-like YbhB/YbcL family protein
MFDRKGLIASCLLFASFSATAKEDFRLTSPTLKHNSTLSVAHVFNGAGCSGGNVSPALKWSGAPAGTKSFAVTVFDPDAPTDSGWWHWIVVNIPATVDGLREAAGGQNGQLLPEPATRVRTDFGSPGYGGACPPVGDKPHRYVFTVFALRSARLDLPKDASAALASFMIRANELGRAQLIATFGR